MAVQIQTRRSSTLNDRPFPTRLGAGELVDSAVNTSNLDASTYNPDTNQDTVVDAGLYINVES